MKLRSEIMRFSILMILSLWIAQSFAEGLNVQGKLDQTIHIQDKDVNTTVITLRNDDPFPLTVQLTGMKGWLTQSTSMPNSCGLSPFKLDYDASCNLYFTVENTLGGKNEDSNTIDLTWTVGASSNSQQIKITATHQFDVIGTAYSMTKEDWTVEVDDTTSKNSIVVHTGQSFKIPVAYNSEHVFSLKPVHDGNTDNPDDSINCKFCNTCTDGTCSDCDQSTKSFTVDGDIYVNIFCQKKSYNINVNINNLEPNATGNNDPKIKLSLFLNGSSTATETMDIYKEAGTSIDTSKEVTFSHTGNDGDQYKITMEQTENSKNQTCSISGNEGSISTNDITANIACGAPMYQLHGSVTGLASVIFTPEEKDATNPDKPLICTGDYLKTIANYDCSQCTAKCGIKMEDTTSSCPQECTYCRLCKVFQLRNIAGDENEKIIFMPKVKADGSVGFEEPYEFQFQKMVPSNGAYDIRIVNPQPLGLNCDLDQKYANDHTTSNPPNISVTCTPTDIPQDTKVYVKLVDTKSWEAAGYPLITVSNNFGGQTAEFGEIINKETGERNKADTVPFSENFRTKSAQLTLSNEQITDKPSLKCIIPDLEPINDNPLTYNIDDVSTLTTLDIQCNVPPVVTVNKAHLYTSVTGHEELGIKGKDGNNLKSGKARKFVLTNSANSISTVTIDQISNTPKNDEKVTNSCIGTDGPDLAPGKSCTITVAPGTKATCGKGDSTKDPNKMGTITITFKQNSLSPIPPISMNYDVLDYGCNYENKGAIFAFDDSSEESYNVNGKLFKLAEPATSTGWFPNQTPVCGISVNPYFDGVAINNNTPQSDCIKPDGMASDQTWDANINGFENSSIIRDLDSTKFPAKITDFCTNGYYVPAICELIKCNKDNFCSEQCSVETIQNIVDLGTLDKAKTYWSSTQAANPESSAMVVRGSGDTLVIGQAIKTNTAYVPCVRSF